MRYVSSSLSSLSTFLFFFFNDTATTEIYTLSLHDALPIYSTPWTTLKIAALAPIPSPRVSSATRVKPGLLARVRSPRSEERRVGKECRSRWSPDDYKKNTAPGRARGDHVRAHR